MSRNYSKRLGLNGFRRIAANLIPLLVSLVAILISFLSYRHSVQVSERHANYVAEFDQDSLSAALGRQLSTFLADDRRNLYSLRIPVVLTNPDPRLRPTLYRLSSRLVVSKWRLRQDTTTSSQSPQLSWYDEYVAFDVPAEFIHGSDTLLYPELGPVKVGSILIGSMASVTTVFVFQQTRPKPTSISFQGQANLTPWLGHCSQVTEIHETWKPDITEFEIEQDHEERDDRSVVVTSLNLQILDNARFSKEFLFQCVFRAVTP